MNNTFIFIRNLLFVVFFGLTGNQGSAQVIWVDAANTSGIEDGTELHPFNTIREGITAAPGGTLVKIKQGTYHPDETWSGNPKTLFLKPGVSLEGEGRLVTLIDGIVVDRDSSQLPTGIEKLGFTEYHFARPTIGGPFAGKNTIVNCSAELISLEFKAGIMPNDTTPGQNHSFDILGNDLGTAGIIEFKQGSGNSGLNVRRNICGYIYLKSGGGYTYLVDSNTVENGIFDMSGACHTTISGNRLVNGPIVDRSGGNQYGAEDEVIENNIITADESSPGFTGEFYKAGIYASSRAVSIRNNAITCTGHVSGIHTTAGAPMHITGNTIVIVEVTNPGPDPDEGTCGILNFSGWGFVTGNNITGGGIGYYTKAGTVEFANNEIAMAYTGFFGSGAEIVHHNSIKNCHGDGVVLNGQRGPLHNNEVVHNAGAGIRVARTPIDLGGGEDGSPGLNTLKDNGDFDLYIQSANATHPILYARYNYWDHEAAGDIAGIDIRDGSDSTGLVVVDFTPIGGVGEDAGSGAGMLTAVPNPFRGSALVTWNPAMGGAGTVQEPVILSIYDPQGRKVREMAMQYGPGPDARAVISAYGLAPGEYLCVVGPGPVRAMVKLLLVE